MLSSIPFNLWRACHWYNHPNKKGSRPSKKDYKYYFTHNVHITTSGNFSTLGLKFCIEELGVERCLYAIGTSHPKFDFDLTDFYRYAIRKCEGRAGLVEDRGLARRSEGDGCENKCDSVVQASPERLVFSNEQDI